MDDSELDALLTEAIVPLPASMSRQAELLAEATGPAKGRRRVGPRPRWFIPVVLVGSLALTGAASITVVQLSGWPWVELPTDHLRSNRIPVDYTTDEGHTESCGAYIELQNADRDDIAALNAAIDSRDWTGFGQDLYERGTPVAEDPDSEIRVGDELFPELVAMTKEAIPGALGLAESADIPTGEPGAAVAIGAMGMSCRVDNQ